MSATRSAERKKKTKEGALAGRAWPAFIYCLCLCYYSFYECFCIVVLHAHISQFLYARDTTLIQVCFFFLVIDSYVLSLMNLSIDISLFLRTTLTFYNLHVHFLLGVSEMAVEEFSLDSVEGGRIRRKSKKEVLIAKDVDIEKVIYNPI